MLMMEGEEPTLEIHITKFDDAAAKRFRSEVQKRSAQDPTRPIVIAINSFGGDIGALASMVGTMASVPNKFIGVCTGKAMSCGAMLLALCDIRFCEENSMCMIHQSSTQFAGDIDDVVNTTEYLSSLNRKWLDIFAKRCGMKGFDEFKEVLRKRDGKDIYMDAEEAKRFGLVDFIGTPNVNPVVTWVVSNSNQADPMMVIANDIGEEEEPKFVKPAKKKLKK